MKLNELNYKKEAPCSGCILAYTSNRVIFEKYTDLENLPISDDSLLELHLFDSEKEYRAVASEDKRFKGFIEHTAHFPDGENVYKETVLLENKLESSDKITVLNLINTNGDGSVAVSDYRLILEV